MFLNQSEFVSCLQALSLLHSSRLCFPQKLERASFLIRLSLLRFEHAILVLPSLYFIATARFIRAGAPLIANCSPSTSSRLRDSKFGHLIAEGPFHIAVPLIVLSHSQHPLRSLEVARPSGTTAHSFLVSASSVTLESDL